MTIGSTMPIVTMIDAGATIAAAVHGARAPCARAVSVAAVMRRAVSARHPALGALTPLNVLSHHSFSAASFFAR